MTEARRTEIVDDGLVRFRYEKPVGQDSPVAVVPLADSVVLGIDVQVLSAGAEVMVGVDRAAENLWWVLAGQARFFDADGQVFGEFGAFQGVAVPRGASGRFESAGDVDLEILRISAVDPRSASPAGDSPATLQAIHYDTPDLGDEAIKVTYELRSEDMLTLSIEKVRDGGGDDRPHAHFGIEGAWYLLSGSVRFHGMTDADAFDMTTSDGLLVPSGCAYGFGAIGHEPSEFLHIKALDLSAEKHERKNY
jgi:mannose-6-phosphate isomerase-like protein (cupin superfamily)